MHRPTQILTESASRILLHRSVALEVKKQGRRLLLAGAGVIATVLPAFGANWDGGTDTWSTSVLHWDGGNPWVQNSTAGFNDVVPGGAERSHASAMIPVYPILKQTMKYESDDRVPRATDRRGSSS